MQVSSTVRMLVTLLALIPGGAAGQTPPASCSMATVIDSLASAFGRQYVLAREAAGGAAALRGLRDGSAGDPGGSPSVLARRLTETLRSATGDGHVKVEWLDPAGPPAAEADWIARWRAGAPRANHGVARVEILPGNVGYLSIRSFHTYAAAVPTLRAALTLVRHTDALILDLSGNGGGDGVTADAVLWTFLAPDAPWPLRIETRTGVEAPAAAPALEWEAYGADRPLAVVLNGRSFSAAEAVAFALASAGRAVVVGSRSAGGAHIIDAALPLPCGYQAWIPTRRPFAPATGLDWEGVGVEPHVAAPDSAAVRTAQLHLLRALRAQAQPEERALELDRAIEELERQLAGSGGADRGSP